MTNGWDGLPPKEHEDAPAHLLRGLFGTACPARWNSKPIYPGWERSGVSGVTMPEQVRHAGWTYVGPLYPITPADLAAAVEAAKAESDALRSLIGRFVKWAEQKCPCENEEPNPCPLCGASVENLEACKAADLTLPPDLLRDARAIRARAPTPEGSAE